MAAIRDPAPNLQEVLLTRVVRLSGGTQRLLGVAAAAGLGATQPLLAAVADLDDQQLLDGLREAVDQQRAARLRRWRGLCSAMRCWPRRSTPSCCPASGSGCTPLAAALEAGLEAGDAPASQRRGWPTAGAAAGDQPCALTASLAAAAAAEGVYAFAEARCSWSACLLWERVPDAEAPRAWTGGAAGALGAEAAMRPATRPAAELVRLVAIALVDLAQPLRAGLLHEQLARCLRRPATPPRWAQQQAVRLVPPAPSPERGVGARLARAVPAERGPLRGGQGPAEEAIATAERVGARAEEANAHAALGGASSTSASRTRGWPSWRRQFASPPRPAT